MHILISMAAAVPEYTVKQRLAVKVDRGTWQLATVVGIRRKYVDILFDDGDEGEFDKVGDRASVKALPKGTKKNKLPLTLAQVKELLEAAPAKKIEVKKKNKPQVSRRVLDMSGDIPNKPEPERRGRPITITMKPKVTEVPAVSHEPVRQTTGTLKTRLKEHGDKPIHPIDLNRGMVVQVAVNASLMTVLLLTYDEEDAKWNALFLRENSKIIQVSPNHCFTRRAPLSTYEKLWAGKYMRRLDEMES